MTKDLTQYDKIGRKPLSGIQIEKFLGQTKPNNLETLSSNSFFNTSEITKALSLLSPNSLSSSTKIAVYFNSIQFAVVSNRFWDKEKKGEWWTPIQKYFIPEIKDMSIKTKNKYFYGSEKNVSVSQNFNPNKDLYQIFSRMFNGALNAFSCFVNKDQPKLTIDSWNHMREISFERFSHTNRIPWYGRLDEFLQSVEILEQTLKKMIEKDYQTNTPLNSNFDVRLILPQHGLISMRLHHQKIQDFVRDKNSNQFKLTQKKLPKTIILSNKDLEKLMAA